MGGERKRGQRGEKRNKERIREELRILLNNLNLKSRVSQKSNVLVPT